MKLLIGLLIGLLLLTPTVSATAQTAPEAKLDESLRELLERGCVGAQSVIIRTKPGYRQGLRDSLAAHGDAVGGEFPAIESVAATVHCEDLKTLAGFESTHSISTNARVGVQSLVLGSAMVDTAAKAAANAARHDLRAAKGGAKGARARREAEALEDAREAALEARGLEGKAAKELKKSFFATMGLSAYPVSSTYDDDDVCAQVENQVVLENGVVGYAEFGGSGIGIAVLDSGIQPGLDFGSRITAFYDFTYGDIRPATPSDAYGHGTHVAGLIASQFVGIAPNAHLIGLKVLDAKGEGATANVVRAIEFAIVNKALLNIRVLNISLGHPIFESAATDPLVQAVEHAARAGLIVVASAGNFGLNRRTGQPGYAGIVSPGNAPSALTSGAVRTFDTLTRLDDRMAPYSAHGPTWYDGFAKPDVAAPGDNLLSVAAVGSALRVEQELRGNTGNYMRLSGTSMAAGVISGVVARMLAVKQRLTPNAVKAILEYTAIPVLNDAGTRDDALTQGTGQIAVTGAVAFAQAINSDAPVGAAWLSSSLTPSTMIGGVSYAWSQSIIYGGRRVAGATLLNEQRPAFALGIIWGEGVGSEDDNIVWGNNFGDDDNIVWGNSLDLDDNIVWGNNIVWGDEGRGITWGTLADDNIVWGNLFDDDNIVWGNNIVWGDGLIGMSDDDNIVWGNFDDDNIVWGNFDDDNIVWSNLDDDNIVWGNLYDDNIVWGHNDAGIVSGNLFDNDDNIVWGNSGRLGTVMQWSGGFVGSKATNTRARRTRARVEGVR